MQPSLELFLEKLCSRTRLTDQECHVILSLIGNHEHLSPGKQFVVAGDELTSSCIVIAGLCARIGTPGDQGRQITALYLRGDVPDLYGALEPEANSTLEALTSAIIVRISHASMHSAMREFPAITEAFSRYLIEDAEITHEWLINVGGREARSRLAHFLCEVAVRLRKADGNSFSFELPITQSQLAEICGLSTIHINRSLKYLRDSGLIEIRDHEITVPDFRALKTLAQFNDLYLRPRKPRRHFN